MLLAAVAIDGNYGIYPLVVAIVENENQWSWGYFLEKLYEQVGVNRAQGLYFMIDRHKGVLITLEKYFPCVDVRYCCRHIYANFRQKFPGSALKNHFWAVCRSADNSGFYKHMDGIKRISETAHTWLNKIPLPHWCKHLFNHRVKIAHVTNNMTESFNSWINQFRDLPVLKLLEEIRRKTMKLIQDR